jgi:hypothetical protein
MNLMWMVVAYLAGAGTVIAIGVAGISSFLDGLRSSFDSLFWWLT